MKCISLLFSILSLWVSAQKVDTVKINSTSLNQERNVLIYTPAQYDRLPNKKFEVVYVLDAQTRANFDLVHSTLQFLWGQEYAFIVVGIPSPTIKELKQDRNTDFLPTPENPQTAKDYDGFVGGADKFMSFIQSEVIPYVDKKYRTLPEKVVIGHSNGGAFVSHVLLNNSDLFDAYIAISPNYSYDDGQFVKRFEKFSPDKLKTKKFFYVSSANETAAIGWTGWEESNKKVVDLLKNQAWAKKIYFVNKEFKPENHGTTYPVSVFYGLKAFIDFQYQTAENVISYYQDLADKKIIELTPKMVNRLALQCFSHEKYNDAITVIKWAIKKFPNDINLYNSQSDFYEKIGDKTAAKESVQTAIDLLAKMKKDFSEKEYNEKTKYFNDKLQHLNQ